MSTSPVSQTSVNDIPAVEDLYQRARDYQETLIGRAKETAELRRLPDETIKDFHELGFFKIIQPNCWYGAPHRNCIEIWFHTLKPEI